MLSGAFSMFVTGTDGGYLKFAHNSVPGRVVISKIVGNGILLMVLVTLLMIHNLALVT